MFIDTGLTPDSLRFFSNLSLCFRVNRSRNGKRTSAAAVRTRRFVVSLYLRKPIGYVAEQQYMSAALITDCDKPPDYGRGLGH
jgi:hypothetical protein